MVPPFLGTLPTHFYDYKKDGELQGSDIANIVKARGKLKTVTAALPMSLGALVSVAVAGESSVEVETSHEIYIARFAAGGFLRYEMRDGSQADRPNILIPPRSHFQAIGNNESALLLALHVSAVEKAAGGERVPPLGLLGLDGNGGRFLRELACEGAGNVERLAAESRQKFLRNFQNTMAAALAALLHKLSPELRVTSPMIGRRKVADLREWAELDHDDPITVGDLAARCGLGLRALQKNFLRHFDTTPHLYLRGLRLDKCRRLIETGNYTVTEAAVDAGFSHFGHFSAAYDAKFGELPSATLRETKRKL